jgi:thioredoxin-dependent peroxiredoxin
MRLFSLAAATMAATIALASPALAALAVGATAPVFTTKASLAGKPFDFALASALKKGPVVLYFFPAAFTPGCTVEANAFAEATDDFAKMGATVIGMSNDPIEKLNEFSVKECRNKFAVGVADKALIDKYDVPLAMMPSRSNRTSYVIAPDGKIIFVHSEMAPKGHITGTLAAVKSWHAAHAGAKVKGTK